MKMFRCPFPIDLAFLCQYDAQNIQHSQRQIFQRGFPCCRNTSIFLFYSCANKNFNSLLFLLSFITFVVVLPFFMNFKYNFGLNFNTISLFLLKLKNFIWFPSYKKNHQASQNWLLKCKKYSRVLSRPCPNTRTERKFNCWLFQS